MKTIDEQLDEVLACTDRFEADKWIGKEVLRVAEEWRNGGPDVPLHKIADIGKTLLSNLGYWAGYRSRATQMQLYELTGAVHPIWGLDYPKDPDAALKLGMEWGRKIKAGEVLKYKEPEERKFNEPTEDDLRFEPRD